MKRILVESKENIVYKGENPDSLAAWIYKDESPINKEGRILLDKFEWSQNESNSNLIREEGKGFSFYFARYAYFDYYHYVTDSLSTGGHSAFLAKVPFDQFNISKASLSERLNPKNSVLLLIDKIEEGSKIIIISAAYKSDLQSINLYTENYIKMILNKEYDKRYGRVQEEEDLIRKKIEEGLYKAISDSLINGAKEFEKLLKSYKEKKL